MSARLQDTLEKGPSDPQNEKVARGQLGSRFVLSEFSHRKPEQRQPGRLRALRSHSPSPSPTSRNPEGRGPGTRPS